ncbi:MAG: F0F1 ATP synthase subunit epsilon [Tidjanibacter sp.]|nr:F0F1 ATP synthase subunit epsilon [Tidjanibacter sp.]
MHLRIISPIKPLFEGEVERVLLPGTKAPFVVLRGHAPLISSLTEGRIVYTTPSGEEGSLMISGGFVEVKENNIVVCTE